MVTPMCDSRARPRYPLDDSWLFADPMNLSLQDEPPVQDDAARPESHCGTVACAARDFERSLVVSGSRARLPCLAKRFAIRVRMCVIVALAGAVWAYFGTDTRWQRSELIPVAASAAAVNCPQRGGLSNALRTL